MEVEEDKDLIDLIEEVSERCKMPLSKTLVRNLQLIYELIKSNNNKPILVFGESGIGKSHLIKLASLLFSMSQGSILVIKVILFLNRIWIFGSSNDH